MFFNPGGENLNSIHSYYLYLSLKKCGFHSKFNKNTKPCTELIPAVN